ncbi:MAG: 16S rRNA (adenine(1518)-N(6)/adenine(1519)-N(6))-dimethyltransferase [Candidatus Lloydbacteria bacterium]|nr:16S rRNA (adenine(1518)-N(6)/adenine(1519)-N(6))-dimethyltransferase [Candidatus Lloydbacteria bacterium]
MKPKKSLGQHFLNSSEAVRKIIETAELSREDTVLEVGPGRGVLTKALLEHAGKVIAVEKDEQLRPLLENLFKEEISDVTGRESLEFPSLATDENKFSSAGSLGNIKKGTLELVFGDILKFTEALPLYRGKASVNSGKYKVVANIPYYITGELLRLFLSGDFQPKSMTLLVQKEVAERIAAPDGKESILSLSVKAYGMPVYVQTVSAYEFLPPPKVDSAILHIDSISKDFFKDMDEKAFFALVKTGFSHKRKLLASNLKDTYKGKAFVNLFEKCSIYQNVRAENVSLDGWKCLFISLDKNA